MATNGQDIEYKSADIRKKPKENLIKNIRKETSSEKVSKFVSSGKLKNTLLGILAVLSVGPLIFAIVVSTGSAEDGKDSSGYVNDEVAEVAESVSQVTPHDSGDEYSVALDKINRALEDAESEQDATKVYQLKLVKADFLIAQNQDRVAAEEILVPLLDMDSNISHRYDVLFRMVFIYEKLNETDNLRIYLEHMVELPDEIFPNKRDNTWKVYYEKMLREV